MTITLPEDILGHANLSEADVRVELACGLFGSGRLDYSDALRLSGLARPLFDRELGARRISIYDAENVRRDLQTIRELKLGDRHQ